MFIVEILKHTPIVVWILLLALLALGLSQRAARTVSRRRTMVLPLAMVSLSLYGILSNSGAMALLAWGAAAAISASLLLRLPLPAATHYDRASDSYALPGSYVPLALIMAIFFLNYAVNIAKAMHPELRHDVVAGLVISTAYGLFSGVFIGRAARLWRLALPAPLAQ